MTTTPTYIAAMRRNPKAVTVHLSVDGKWTLCMWRIGDHWQCHGERLPLGADWFSSAKLCRSCKKAAIAEREEKAAP